MLLQRELLGTDTLNQITNIRYYDRMAKKNTFSYVFLMHCPVKAEILTRGVPIRKQELIQSNEDRRYSKSIDKKNWLCDGPTDRHKWYTDWVIEDAQIQRPFLTIIMKHMTIFV